MSFQLVPVNVCGQELVANCSNGQGSGCQGQLQVLRETVEKSVGLQQDWIQFFDSNGTKLLTDAEVITAISEERIPIYGTVAHHSVHDLEQRREEFAHIQWKVMRDQFTVLTLQLGHTQKQLKSLQDQIQATDVENNGRFTAMKNQLVDGLEVVEGCKQSSINSEELVGKLREQCEGLGLKLNQEAMYRDTALRDLEVKMERTHSVQQHETGILAEALDSHINLVQEADSQLRKDIQAQEEKVRDANKLANTNHAVVLQQISESAANSTRAISEACSSLLKEVDEKIEKKADDLVSKIANFEKRIIPFESLASDTASKWLASHEQLKEQCNSVSQAVEQCRLHNRTANVTMHEMKDKLQQEMKELQGLPAIIRAEVAQERKGRDEQFRSFQHNLDATLKTSQTELEQKLCSRVDREADARMASILQALDDIGGALEKEIPSKLRSEAALRSSSLLQEVQAQRVISHEVAGRTTPIPGAGRATPTHPSGMTRCMSQGSYASVRTGAPPRIAIRSPVPSRIQSSPQIRLHSPPPSRTPPPSQAQSPQIYTRSICSPDKATSKWKY